MADGVSFAAEIVLVLSAFLNAGIIFLVYRKLNDSERTNMASFQLNPVETLRDFKAFFGITVLFLISTMLVLIGDVFDRNQVFIAGNLFSVVSSFLPAIIFFRWWRRFK